MPGLLVDGASNGATGVDALDGRDVGGRAVLVRSGWDRRFGTDHYGDTAVLGAGIPVVEHLRGLDTIPDAPFAFSVRAYATI